MSDTSKATPYRYRHCPVCSSFLSVRQELPIYDAARELAEMAADRFASVGALGNHEAGCAYWWKRPRKTEKNCTCGNKLLFDKARRLLKLYEEEKP